MCKKAKSKGLPKPLEFIRRKLNQKSVLGHEKYMVLRIEGGVNSPVVRHLRFYLNDVEISRGLRGCELHMGIETGVVHAHLEIIVRPDIPDILLGQIKIDKVTDPLGIVEEVKGQK